MSKENARGMQDDTISRKAAIDVAWEEPSYTDPINVLTEVREKISNLPSAQPEPKKGKWIEHHVYADEEKVIEEWQSCKCSVCGRYDTRPYLYNFDEPHFCSWCGADMRTKETDYDTDYDYEKAVDQLEHEILYEPTFNQDDGSM